MKKRILTMAVLFALLFTILTTNTNIASAAITEIDKMTKAEATALIAQLKPKIRQIELKDEKKRTAAEEKQLLDLLDQLGNANWRLYVLANKDKWDDKDSTMLRSGVEVPRPRSLWAVKGYPQSNSGLTYMQGVKIKSNWNAYLEGLCSTYAINVKNNVLTISGNNILRRGSDGDLPVKGKFQLVKPTYGLDCYIGSDGLVYMNMYSYDRYTYPENKAVLDSNTLTVLVDESEGKKAERDLSYTMDLSDLSDGIYCFKETVWLTLGADINKMSDYWRDIVVVVDSGKASLQATDIGYNTIPKAPEGRITYDCWRGDMVFGVDGWSIGSYY